ncbi:MAG: hypothetical protein ABI395_08200 [Sphingobium sp.]
MNETTRNATGQPLVFLGLVLSMWTAGRIVVLAANAAEANFAIDFHPAAASARPVGYIADSSHFRASPDDARGSPTWHPALGLSHIWAIPAATRSPEPVQNASVEFAALPTSAKPSATGHGAQHFAPETLAPFPAGAPALPAEKHVAQKRLQGAAWVLWRDRASSPSLARSGQLGGAQAGLRVDYRINGSRQNPVFVYGRASTALYSPRTEELAVGVVWRPSAPLPVSLGVERRIAIGRGARNAFALVATTGIGPTDVAPGLRVEGYGQAGLVGLRNRDAFVDGRIALTHPIARSPFSAGISVSGGAQPHVSRLDIGPVIDARIKLKGVQPRLSVEWRERVAGHAAPNSGPAVTLATDF